MAPPPYTFKVLQFALVTIFFVLLWRVTQLRHDTTAAGGSTIVEPDTPPPSPAARAIRFRNDDHVVVAEPKHYGGGTCVRAAAAPRARQVTADIPALHDLLLSTSATSHVVIVIGRENHYTFLAASAPRVHVHVFDHDTATERMLLQKQQRGRRNWSLNDLYGVGPFISLLLIHEWSGYERELAYIFANCAVRVVVVLDNVDGQCPSYEEYVRTGLPPNKFQCTYFKGYAECKVQR